MERNTLHRLVDMLPEGDLGATQRVLRGLLRAGCDPVLPALLKVRVDDEPMNAVNDGIMPLSKMGGTYENESWMVTIVPPEERAEGKAFMDYGQKPDQ